MFEVDLSSQVTQYGSENPDWGGAACVQMAMSGYPPGATSCLIDQTTIWNYIQANNIESGTGPWGIGWYADPYAITKTLNDLCPPQHHWIDVSDSNKSEVLYKLLRWMANYRYASLVCLNAHDYWNTVVYYKTSDDPRQFTNTALERIGWYEPYYSSWLGGPQVDYKEVDGSIWLNGPYYWGAPCGGFTNTLCGQKWLSKYVGIGEPPEEDGSITVQMFPRVGEKIIGPREAGSIAQKYIVERIKSESKFLSRHLRGLRAVKPMLVRELPCENNRGKQTETNVRYYVIPFASRYDENVIGIQKARLSVLVNAYSGRFEELRVFSRPINYLSAKIAVSMVRRYLSLSRSDVPELDVELVSGQRLPQCSSALPVWKIAIGEKTLYVTQSGLVVGGLYYPNYRGG